MAYTHDMNEAVTKVRDVFDDWARRGRAAGMEREHSPVARQGFERIALQAGARYLDIGCGNGYSVRWAAETAPDVQALGLDVSPEMITLARETSAALENAQFRCAPFPLPELQSGAFDAVFSMEVLYYLPDPDAGLREVTRLLAPGGRFACLMDYYRENPESHTWPEELGLTLALRSQGEWAQAFERAGLRIVEQTRLSESLLTLAEKA